VAQTASDVPNPPGEDTGFFVTPNHAQNHEVLVLGTLGSANDPTFVIDGTSTLDLEDNDMIIHTGTSDQGQSAPLDPSSNDSNVGYDSLYNAQQLAIRGRDGGLWDGTGLTSTVAENQDSNDGAESTQLAVVNNADLAQTGVNGGLGYTAWKVGNASEALGANDTIIKYTYTGDLNLDGVVNQSDFQTLTSYSDNGTSSDNEWAFGDTNGDGKLNSTDFGNLLGNSYGDGTNGVLGGNANDPYAL